MTSLAESRTGGIVDGGPRRAAADGAGIGPSDRHPIACGANVSMKKSINLWAFPYPPGCRCVNA